MSPLARAVFNPGMNDFLVHHCQQHELISVNTLAFLVRTSYKCLITEPKLPFFILLELHELN